MKLKTIIAALALTVGLSNAAVISTANVAGADGNVVVVDNSGAPIPGLTASIVLSTGFGGAIPTTAEELAAATLANLDTGNGLAGAAGAFSSNYSGADGTGEAIYLVFSDGGSNWGLIDTGLTLDPDGASPDSNVFIMTAGAGTPIVGEYSSTQVTADWTAAVGGSNTGSTFVLALVPEPSSALLAGLALVGGFIRRRR